MNGVGGTEKHCDIIGTPYTIGTSTVVFCNRSLSAVQYKYHEPVRCSHCTVLVQIELSVLLYVQYQGEAENLKFVTFYF